MGGNKNVAPKREGRTMKMLIKNNDKIVQEYDYNKHTNTNEVDMVRDMRNALEYIEKNGLSWTIEITK